MVAGLVVLTAVQAPTAGQAVVGAGIRSAAVELRLLEQLHLAKARMVARGCSLRPVTPQTAEGVVVVVKVRPERTVLTP